MKRLEIKEEKYMESLVMMIYGLEKLEVRSRVLYLIELIKESENGYLVNNDKRPIIMKRLGLSYNNYEMLLNRLVLSGDVRRDNGIVWLAPKWRAVKECGGEFLISSKKKLEDIK